MLSWRSRSNALSMASASKSLHTPASSSFLLFYHNSNGIVCSCYTTKGLLACCEAPFLVALVWALLLLCNAQRDSQHRLAMDVCWNNPYLFIMVWIDFAFLFEETMPLVQCICEMVLCPDSCSIIIVEKDIRTFRSSDA